MRDKLGSTFCCRFTTDHFSIGSKMRTLLSVNHNDSEVLDLIIPHWHQLVKWKWNLMRVKNWGMDSEVTFRIKRLSRVDSCFFFLAILLTKHLFEPQRLGSRKRLWGLEVTELPAAVLHTSQQVLFVTVLEQTCVWMEWLKWKKVGCSSIYVCDLIKLERFPSWLDHSVDNTTDKSMMHPKVLLL